MAHKRLKRVDIQVTILTGIIVICSCSLIFWLNYTMSYNDMIHGLQDRVMSIYTYLESSVTAASFEDINVREDENSLIYQRTKTTLKNVKNTTGVMYLYTAKQAEDGSYIYLVDGLPSTNTDFRHVGDPIEPEIIPDIERALRGEPILPDKIKNTSWGYIFISYLPVYSEGRLVGVVGIEFPAEHQYKTFMFMRVISPIVIILACFAASAVAVIIFKRISNPTYRDLANTDLLTGLKNRNAFDIDLNNLNNQKLCLGAGIICLDLDRLKIVNDTYGHQAGDDYIKSACRLFEQFMADGYVLYRVGGDEFAAIIREFCIEEVQWAAGEMIRWMDEKNEIADAEKPVPNFSIGYAAYDPEKDKDLTDTWKRADQAMYEQKKRKKNEMTGGSYDD